MSIFDTIGIEVETDSLTQRSASYVTQNFSRGQFEVTRDASIESQVFMTEGGKNVLTKRPAINNRSMKVVIGSEFVSRPLRLDEFRTSVRTLTGILRTMGEPERSKRASIHIHVGCSSDLYVLKNALKLFYQIEPLFYRLGGMGYAFRGEDNNSIYCRPITSKFGPPVVVTENGKACVIFDPKDLLNAKSLASFWYIMGINTERAERYHPSRYFGLNLFSTILHGTLEFRYFNKTLDHRKISSVASLCQCIVELISNHELKIPEEITESMDDQSRLRFITRLISQNNKEYLMSDRDLYVMESILTTTTPYKIPEEYIRTHLINKFVLSERFLESYERPFINLRDAKDSGFIDIHNIGKSFDMLNSIS